MSFKRGFVYVFMSNIIGLVISIITGFVLPKYLSIDTYASIKLFQLYIAYVGILHLGYSDGMYLKYGGEDIAKINKKSIKSEFITFKCFQFLIMIVAITVSIIIDNNILLLCSCSILPINIGNYLKNLYQATGKFDIYAKFTNLNNLFVFVINILLLFIIKSDNGMFYIIGYVISYFIYWLLLEKEINRFFGNENGKFDIKYFFEDIKDGFLLMLGNFSNVVFTSIDRLLIKHFLGSIKFAYYSFAVSIESLMNTVVGPVSIVLYNYFCKNRDKDKILFIKRMLLIFTSFVLMVVYPVGFIVEHWITKYSSSLKVLFLLFVAQFFTILVKCVFNNLYKANKKQKRYFVIMIIIIIISIITNLIGYYIFKAMEIFAIATMITSIIWFIIGEIDFREYHYAIKEYLYIIFIITIFLLTSICFTPGYGFIVYLILFILFTILLLPKEVKYIKKECIKYINKMSKLFAGKK